MSFIISLDKASLHNNFHCGKFIKHVYKPDIFPLKKSFNGGKYL